MEYTEYLEYRKQIHPFPSQLSSMSPPYDPVSPTLQGVTPQRRHQCTHTSSYHPTSPQPVDSHGDPYTFSPYTSFARDDNDRSQHSVKSNDFFMPSTEDLPKAVPLEHSLATRWDKRTVEAEKLKEEKSTHSSYARKIHYNRF